MEELKNQILEQMNIFISNSEKDSKSAHARMRKATLSIAKLGKEYRRISIEEDKK